MKRTEYVLAGILVSGLGVLVGCQPAATSSASAPAQFEVRDFALEEHAGSYGATTVGRGTLVAKSEQLKHGSYIVYLSATRSHKSDSNWRQAVILRDGLATFETSDYLVPEDRATKVKYGNWGIYGFAQLQEGVIVSDGKPQ